MPKTIKPVSNRPDEDHRFMAGDVSGTKYYHTFAQCRDAIIKVVVAADKRRETGDRLYLGNIYEYSKANGWVAVSNINLDVLQQDFVFSGSYCSPNSYTPKKWSKTVKR